MIAIALGETKPIAGSLDMPKINAERLLKDLRDLRAIGTVRHGVVRPAFSDTDMEARRWLKKRYEEAGLDATLDGVGNVLGRSRKNGPALIIGSHSDTQPEGGWLDGALGVIYGLEVARACAEDPETADLPIDAVSWQDEESNFLGCLGSRSWCGALDPLDEAAATGPDGESLADALVRTGLADVPRLAIEEGRHAGYL
jgi:N-carbamoyl-L-amino-acid hydrolase